LPTKYCLLRLYRHGDHKRSVDVNTHVDPTNTVRLRELLEERVQAKVGHLHVDLHGQGWELRVLAAGGGRVYATVRVDNAGRTVVTR
jgi:hypothetical protein